MACYANRRVRPGRLLPVLVGRELRGRLRSSVKTELIFTVR